MRLGGRHNMPPPVRAKFEDRSFFRLRNIEGVPEFRNWVTYPRPRPLMGQFVVRGQELPTAYVRAKFEDRSFTRLRNIEGVPEFRNWVSYPRPRPLRGQYIHLYSPERQQQQVKKHQTHNKNKQTKERKKLRSNRAG